MISPGRKCKPPRQAALARVCTHLPGKSSSSFAGRASNTKRSLAPSFGHRKQAGTPVSTLKGNGSQRFKPPRPGQSLQQQKLLARVSQNLYEGRLLGNRVGDPGVVQRILEEIRSRAVHERRGLERRCCWKLHAVGHDRHSSNIWFARQGANNLHRGRPQLGRGTCHTHRTRHVPGCKTPANRSCCPAQCTQRLCLALHLVTYASIILRLKSQREKTAE